MSDPDIDCGCIIAGIILLILAIWILVDTFTH